jgi:hypothetical protein
MVEPPNADPVETVRKQRGRPFEPGQSGNPSGRPRGARGRATQAVEALMSRDVDVKAITKVVLREARAGQPWACVAWLKLIAPAPRGRLVQLDLPPVRSAADIPAALLAVAGQVAAGELTPTEGCEIAAVYDALRASFEVDELTREVARLKAWVEEMPNSPWNPAG